LGTLEEMATLLFGRRKQIEDEMNRLSSAFRFNQDKSGPGGCLRLEEVYCIKRGRKYGPYGPYYYVYFHRTERMEKRYLGKRADRFISRREVLDQFRRLEEEYKQILGLERAMSKGGKIFVSP
jgi:hypothetical protein